MQLFYTAKKGGTGNVFSSEALAEMKDFESQIVALPSFQQICSRQVDPEQCDVLESVVTIFYASTKVTGSSQEVKYDGKGLHVQNIEDTLRRLIGEGKTWWYDTGCNLNHLSSTYTRTTVWGGDPVNPKGGATHEKFEGYVQRFAAEGK